METVTGVLSVIGLFFAAVAAWGAVTAVRVTLDMRQEADRRTMIDALITVEDIADELILARLAGTTDSALDKRFALAQQGLRRAFFTTGESPGDVGDLVIELLEASPREDPSETRSTASGAISERMDYPAPNTKSPWPVGLMKRLAHPLR